MNYLIDTNICIYIMNQRPASVIDKFKTMAPGDIGISSITVSELQYGVAKSNRKSENARRLSEFLLPFDILPYDSKAASVYGRIRSQLEDAGQTIGPLDMLIGAHALSQNLIIVTNDTKEFSRIDRLTVENWV
ncbi:MAG: type II toxin-antitoxin system VapC family toxin [Desulfobacterales bacterium]|nr:type II toxin-antitoxin system VapC family toxin [Desulfobacterales bacterium]